MAKVPICQIIRDIRPRAIQVRVRQVHARLQILYLIRYVKKKVWHIRNLPMLRMLANVNNIVLRIDMEIVAGIKEPKHVGVDNRLFGLL